MNSDVIREWLARRPFEPFLVKFSNGDSYEIRHPENVIVMKSRIIVGYPETERVVHCGLIRVNSIEALQHA